MHFEGLFFPYPALKILAIAMAMSVLFALSKKKILSFKMYIYLINTVLTKSTAYSFSIH